MKPLAAAPGANARDARRTVKGRDPAVIREMLRDKRILLVEDEVVTVHLLRELLARYGYTVAGAIPRGEMVAEAVERTGPDLVLMDIFLEGEMDGIEAALRLRETNDLPIIFLTAGEDDDLLDRAKEASPSGYILKPFTEGSLRATIELALYRHEMEKRLRERDERIRLLGTAAHDGMVLMDEEGKIRYWNPAAERIFGYSRVEAIGSDLHELVVPEEHREHAAAGIARFRETGAGAAIGKMIEMTAVRKDGSTVPVELSVSAVRVRGEWNAIGVVRDVTERIRAAEELRCSREVFHNIVTRSGDGVLVIDLEGKIRFANPAAVKIFGAVGGSLVGDFFGLPVIGDRMTEIEIPRRGGPPRVVEMHAEETEWAGEQAFLASLRDISERRRLQAELEETRRRELRTKDDFLSHVSHEFRTPLASIVQFVEILLDGLGGELTADQKEYLDIVSRNAKQLREMIEDLLLVTLVRSGRLAMEFRHVETRPLMESVLASFEPAAEEVGVSLELSQPDDPPPLFVDPDRAWQILSNLIRNGLKFTPAGGAVRVSVRAEESDPRFLRFEVRDTGCGISSTNLETVFDRLYQESEEIDAGRQGLGLGLAICKELVECHGGTIRATSGADGGTVFRFTLPVFSFDEQVREVIEKGDKYGGQASLLTIRASLRPGVRSRKIGRDTSRTIRTAVAVTGDSAGADLLPRIGSSENEEIALLVAPMDEAEAWALTARIRESVARNAAPQLRELILETKAEQIRPAAPGAGTAESDLVSVLVDRLRETTRETVKTAKER